MFHHLKRLTLIVLAMLSTLSYVAVARPVHALCATLPIEGSWVNVDPNTPSITHVDIRHQCSDQVLNGHPYPPEGNFVHLYGKCHPSDCDWGEVAAYNYIQVGPVKVPLLGVLYTTYNQVFAVRQVFVAIHGNTMQVQVLTHFRDPNRKDYTSNDTFTHS